MSTYSSIPSKRVRPSATLVAALATLALTAGLLLPRPSAATDPQICPVPDPDACLVECRIERARCGHACRAEKSECIERARLHARVCKLDCREDDSVDNVGECRRDCVKKALRHAVADCGLGKPICLRECNPGSCLRECGLDEPVADLHSDGTDHCVPPIDRPCLGKCAREFVACIKPVRVEARECAATCSDLSGEERIACYRTCAEAAHAGATECRGTLRKCASECREVDIPRPGEECVRDCRADLGICLDSAWEQGRTCALEECNGLEGEDRRVCLGRCAHGAKEAAGDCENGFRRCLVGCKEDIATAPTS